MSIAAIIPLYNGAPFIREALESVFRQTIPVDEIIVVNDGSTDEGPDIVRAMAANHPIRLLEQPNSGQSAARNLAARSTECDHVAFLDQDDVWHDDHVEVLSRPLREKGAGKISLVYGDLDQIDRKGGLVLRGLLRKVPTVHPKTSRVDCLVADMFILPSASLVGRKAFLEAGGFDERLSGYEDDDLFQRMFALGYQLTFVNEPVTKWRIYPSSTSFTPRMGRSRMIYFHKLVESYPDEPRMELYWVRDIIAPRFFNLVAHDVAQAARHGDEAALRQAWKDLQIITPFIRKKKRWRTEAVTPIVNAIGPATSPYITRKLLKWATASMRR